MLSCFSLINSYFDQWHVRKQGLKMTHSSIVEQNQNNCQRKNCLTSHLLWYFSDDKDIIKLLRRSHRQRKSHLFITSYLWTNFRLGKCWFWNLCLLIQILFNVNFCGNINDFDRCFNTSFEIVFHISRSFITFAIMKKTFFIIHWLLKETNTCIWGGKVFFSQHIIWLSFSLSLIQFCYKLVLVGFRLLLITHF